jgi:hypothetical protein
MKRGALVWILLACALRRSQAYNGATWDLISSVGS